VSHGRFPVVPPLVALALAACAGEPTASTAALPAAHGPSLQLTSSSLAELRGAVSDASSRLLPVLGGPAHARLRASLQATDRALASDDAAALAASLAEARAAVAADRALLGAGAAEAPDLDAFLLMLDGLQVAVPESLARGEVAAGAL
jgi:hypothetical protein